MSELRQYKSCIGCKAYEYDDPEKTRCNLLFPIALIDSPKEFNTVIGDPFNTSICYHRPKHGCEQKWYNNKTFPKSPHETQKRALKLSEND